MKLPDLLFHGTSDGYLEAILRDGLDHRSAGNGYLCYTDDDEVARYHAGCMAEWDQGILGKPCMPVLFAIPIVAFDPQAFVLEQNFIELGPSGGRACNPKMTDHIKQRHLVTPWTWDEMLEYAGAVGYAKTLKVDRTMMTMIADRPVMVAATP